MRDVRSFTPVSMIIGILLTRVFTTDEIICGRACTIVKMIYGRFVISAVKSWTPASTISGKWSRSVVIVDSMICGNTSHIVVMISGRASTSDVKRVIPVSIICGIASRSDVTRLSMSVGSASSNTGIASITPCASPVMSWRAASMRSLSCVSIWRRRKNERM